MKERSIPLTICAATTAAALVLTGCTVTVTSDGINLEKAVEALQVQTGASVTLQCPEEDIPFEAGLVTVCPATLDGANARVEITQLDDQGNVDLFIGIALNTDALQSEVEAEIGVPVEVQCPEDIPLEEGLVVECLVTAAGVESEGIILVTQKDNLGNVSWTFS